MRELPGLARVRGGGGVGRGGRAEQARYRRGPAQRKRRPGLTPVPIRARGVPLVPPGRRAIVIDAGRAGSGRDGDAELLRLHARAWPRGVSRPGWSGAVPVRQPRQARPELAGARVCVQGLRVSRAEGQAANRVPLRSMLWPMVRLAGGDPPGAAGARAQLGKPTSMRRPPSLRALAVIVASCAAAIAWTIERPSPSPLEPLVRSDSSRWNG